MFRTILVGTDGSESAGVAVGAAAGLAARTGAELLVASAHPGARARATAVIGPPEAYRGEDRARAIVEDERGRHGGVALRAIVREGHPADVLLDLAEEEQVDLVVVGNRGMGGARRFLVGSVPNNVSHHAPCHVLIVASIGETARPAAGGFGRILVGTDGSASANRAVRLAGDLARTVEGSLVLVHVGKDVRVLEGADVPQDVPVDREIVSGSVAEALLEAAERHGADLIVVGNKGMSGPRRFLVGSVPNTISHEADRSVLIARTG
jgi:nucleotide-binding universal stress UspA family protein